MKIVTISRQDMECIKRLQVKSRSDRLISFIVNPDGHVWAYLRRGYTGPLAPDVRGRCRKLDEIADEFLQVRNRGGRFFIDKKGVFYKDDELKGAVHHFLQIT